jgi:hypothetical protein
VLALAPQPALAVPPLDRNHAVDDAASPFVQGASSSSGSSASVRFF